MKASEITKKQALEYAKDDPEHFSADDLWEIAATLIHRRNMDIEEIIQDGRISHTVKSYVKTEASFSSWMEQGDARRIQKGIKDAEL